MTYSYPLSFHPKQYRSAITPDAAEITAVINKRTMNYIEEYFLSLIEKITIYMEYMVINKPYFY